MLSNCILIFKMDAEISEILEISDISIQCEFDSHWRQLYFLLILKLLDVSFVQKCQKCQICVI